MIRASQALWSIVAGGAPKAESGGMGLGGGQRVVSSHAVICPLPESPYVAGLQLSLWDNIFGPKVHSVWMNGAAINDEVQTYVARHTLAGEISRPDRESEHVELEPKFHLFAELGFLVVSLIFTAPFMGVSTKFSLSAFVEHRHLERYLVVHDIFEDRFMQIARRLFVLMELDRSYRILEAFLPRFVADITCLFNSFLPAVSFSQTVFGEGALLRDDADFVARAVTSHLQTHMRTIVVGADEAAVNTIIYSLSLFLSPTQKQLASLCDASPSAVFTPDLYLQGFVLPDSDAPGPRRVDDDASLLYSVMAQPRSPTPVQQEVVDSSLAALLTEENLIQGTMPCTIVDLRDRSVRQTRQFHEYRQLRKDFMDFEMDRLESILASGKLTTGSEDELAQAVKDYEWSVKEGLHRVVRSSAPRITALLGELARLPTPLRDAYLAEQLRLLTRAAVLLIKYVETELVKAESSLLLHPRTIGKIKFDMALGNNDDFQIIVGIAEYLSPGVYAALLPDPTIIEAQFLALFDMLI